MAHRISSYSFHGRKPGSAAAFHGSPRGRKPGSAVTPVVGPYAAPLPFNANNKDHGSQTRFKCEICGKEFYQQQHYLGHTNVHLGLRPFKCPGCNRGFPYRSQLAAHKKMCINKSGIKCEKCGECFGTERQLMQHSLKVHVGSYMSLFQCVHCKVKFSSQDSLTDHKKFCAMKDSKTQDNSATTPY